LTVGPVVFGDFFAGAIAHAPDGALAELGAEFHGPTAFVLHALQSPVLYLALAGIATAWYLYLKRPELPDRIATRYARLYRLLVNKYYFDWFNENVVATGVRNFGGSLWKRGDETVIDGWLVNGSARAIGSLAAVVRNVQSGYLYHYAFAMIIGLSLLLGWLLLRS
ncbi:MAG: NADH-quinone oxidoreductase subunit L, partial [Steroidobacteraceae bacterium]